MTNTDVRVRFAPSPTGHLHVGGARTALFNWLYARKTGGTFVLRIEDTDQARSTLESEQIVKSDLKWLGMDWNEGPEIGGDAGPYRQSERREIYREHAYRLLNSDHAYRCFCTDSELEAKREQAEAEKRSPHYDGTCRNLSEVEVQEKLNTGIPHTLRFRVPDKSYTVNDRVRGSVTWEAGTLGDFIILRSDGMPVYNFCVVVDDYLMKMTHVIRAEEHLSNTLRQLMLYEALGWNAPEFAHASLILGQDRSKLSKRHGATSVNQFQEQGYLPAAMVNYLALLGWNEGNDREEYTVPELVEAFSLNRIVKSPAVFDMDKLNWLNGMHLRNLDDNALLAGSRPFILEAFPFLTDKLDKDPAWGIAVMNMLKNKLTVFGEIKERLAFLFNYEPVMDEAIRTFFEDEKHREAGRLMATRILDLEDLNGDTFWEAAMSIKKDGFKGKHLFHPLRALISGELSGPEMDVMVNVLLTGEDIPELVSIKQRCTRFLEGFGN